MKVILQGNHLRRDVTKVAGNDVKGITGLDFIGGGVVVQGPGTIKWIASLRNLQYLSRRGGGVDRETIQAEQLGYVHIEPACYAEREFALLQGIGCRRAAGCSCNIDDWG